jgi:uncharacterized membrane protein YeaQ/YmgE (transglycosylase-associated protein family)
MTIIGWIIFGLVVGAIARFLMPGEQPMGIILTTLLGIAGAFVGGAIANMIGGGSLNAPRAVSWIGAVLGALLLLFLYGLLTRRKV